MGAHLHPTLCDPMDCYCMYAAAAAAAELLQSCLTLCDSIDGSPPGSPIPGILQARTLEWVGDPMDCGPPGSSVRGIFQARVLEWGAIAFSVHLNKAVKRNERKDKYIFGRMLTPIERAGCIHCEKTLWLTALYH